MKISDFLIYSLPVLVAVVAGGVAGAVTAWKFRPSKLPVAELVAASVVDDDTEFVNSEIDLAAVKWAEANGYPPEAAGLMAERLKTLHEIGKGKGWFS